ncbi:MAG: hypothetical protein Q8936_01905 [Bacillota bacterium]|nr:hypothetical protein [Bacillota bacterium]
MENIKDNITKKIAYLYCMAEKYEDLNSKARGQYNWRLQGIHCSIQALEEILSGDVSFSDWDEAYKEDLKEFEERGE